MTVPGIDATVWRCRSWPRSVTRFRTRKKLAAYLGLNPRVRQSGGQPANHGRITKAGSAHARGMLVVAAWPASKASGPLRAFYQRVATRRCASACLASRGAVPLPVLHRCSLVR